MIETSLALLRTWQTKIKAYPPKVPLWQSMYGDGKYYTVVAPTQTSHVYAFKVVDIGGSADFTCHVDDLVRTVIADARFEIVEDNQL